MTAAPEPVESTPTAPPAEPMKPARPAEPMKPARPAEPTGLAPSAKPNVLPPSAWLLQWGVRGEADSNFPWLVEPTDPVVAVLTGIPTDTGNPTDTGTGDWFETVATVPIAATGAVPVTALSGEEATTVYYTPDGAHAYLLQPRWDGVHLVVVDTATGRTTPVIVVPGAPPSAIPTGEDGPDLWFGPDGTHAYLVTSRRVEPEPSPAGPARYPSYVTDLTIIETATGAATTTELGPGASYQVVFAPNGGRLYTLGYTVSDTGRRTDRLTVVDIATGRVLDVIGLTDPADIGRGRPTGALTPDGRHLYVAGDSGYAVDLTIVRVGTTTGERSEIVRTNVPGRGFGFLKTTSDDAVGYLASTEPDTSSANGYRTYLTAVDLTDGTTRRVTTAPGTAVDLGFAPDGRLGYLITKANDARSFAAVTYLTELDLARDSSTAITVAGAPEPLVFDSTGNRIYLTTHSYDRSTRASSTLLTTIDTVAGETGTRVGPETAAPVVTQGGAQIYLAASDHDTTTLTRIDTASGASNTLDRAGARTALSVTPDRARLVLSTVTDADTPAARSTVTAVDTASGNPTATVTLPGTTDDLVIDDSGRHAYLTAELRDPNGALSTVLTRIDTTTGATDTVDVRAGRPMRVDFAPDTRSVYLTTWVVDVGPVITLIRLS